MRHSISIITSLAFVFALACTRKDTENKPQPQQQPPAVGSAPLAAAPSAAPAPAASSAAAPASIPEVDPVCQIESKKVWVTGANKGTGLTEATLPDGRVAIGFAVGNQPHVLLVSANAKGTVVKVPIAKTSRLGSVPKGATRFLMRVTPVSVEGDNVRAFVDFEDHYPDKRRSVVCGPADANENWVEFEGIPFTARKAPKPEEVAALFHQQGAEKLYDEVHTCRTFASLGQGDTWVLSSDLHGVLQADNSVAWRTDFTVATGDKTKKRIIESTPVNNKTLDDEFYEAPVSHALKNGSYVVAARHRNHLTVGLLGADKAPIGQFSRYAGYPTMPDIAPDDDSLVLSTSFAKGKGEWGLRALRISEKSPELPKSLHVVVTDKNNDQSSSESDPDFVRDVKGQRWVAHIEGTRGDGKLSLAPISKDFRAIGRSYAVTQEGEHATAARVIAMKDKGLMVVFLHEGEKALELVTEEVHCKIEQ
jgi:hypothetical protein